MGSHFTGNWIHNEKEATRSKEDRRNARKHRDSGRNNGSGRSENDATVTVNSKRYFHMLQTFLRPQLRRSHFRGHRSRVRQVFGRMFPGRVNTRVYSVAPQFWVLANFSCGNISSHQGSFIIPPPATLVELKEAIKEEWLQTMASCCNGQKQIFFKSL